MIGTKLAHFQITGHLGSGGMGDVYEAADSKLGRSVAIKLLPEAFARDSERVARFEREARVLASLNHPNIAAIYGLERVGGRMFLVMECVPGETLAQRINKGRLPIDEALGIAKQIAEGVEAAHEKGVVHRDLKPANVKITPEGRVKVLDFGLAKAYAPEAAGNADLSNSPTLVSAASMPGAILGTAAYMSPEQAKGKEVDKRTDIFALGCVLYEMLTGQRAFDGDDVTDILSAVLRADPDWARLPAGTPTAVRNLLRLCLEKNAINRRQSAGDVRIDLEMALKSPQAAEPPVQARSRSAVLWVASALLLSGAAIAGAVLYRTPPKPAVVAFDVRPPGGVVLGSNGSTPIVSNPGVISPDGQTLAFIGTDSSGKVRIYVRALSSTTARPLPGSEDALGLFWSPDSRRIGFRSPDKIKTVDIAGGAMQSFNGGPAFSAFQGGETWGPDGTILFGSTSNQPILKIDPAGGDPVPVTTIQGIYPSFLPDGRHFIFAHKEANSREFMPAPWIRRKANA